MKKSKDKKNSTPTWVAVKVERGYISKAKIFKSLTPARNLVRHWQTHLNPDYDEAAVLVAD